MEKGDEETFVLSDQNDKKWEGVAFVLVSGQMTKPI